MWTTSCTMYMIRHACRKETWNAPMHGPEKRMKETTISSFIFVFIEIKTSVQIYLVLLGIIVHIYIRVCIYIYMYIFLLCVTIPFFRSIVMCFLCQHQTVKRKWIWMDGFYLIHFLSTLEEKNGNLSQVKINEMFCLMCHITSKISTNNDMPSGIVLFIEFFFNVCRNVLVVCKKGYFNKEKQNM